MTSRPTAAGINPDVESDLDQCGARPARDAISDQEAVHLWTSKDIEGSVAAQLDSGGCQVVRANRLAAGARTRRGRWLALVGLVPVGTFLVPVAPAEAYALLGCQYGVSSATWHYATGYPPPSGYDTPTRNAAASWGAATRFDWNYVDSVYAANVVIANYGNTGWDGLEEGGGCNGTNNPPIIRANRYDQDSYGANKKRSVIAHEFGHALGLAHSGGPNSACGTMHLMNPATYDRFTRCGVYTPQTDDINGTNAMYPY